MQAATHIAIGMAGLVLTNTVYGAPEINTMGCAVVAMASVLPDIDNHKSLVGRIAGVIVRLLTLHWIILGEHLQHRKTFHNPFINGIFIIASWFLVPDYAGYISVGLGLHLFFDTFQEKGIHLIDNYWLRFSEETDIEERSGKDVGLFLAISLALVAPLYFNYKYKSLDSFLREFIGTPNAAIEEYMEHEDWICDLKVNRMTESSEKGVEIPSGVYRIFGVNERRMLIRDKNNRMFELEGNAGFKRFNSCVTIPKQRAKVFEFEFELENRLLGEVLEILDTRQFYFFHGTAFTDEEVKIEEKKMEYNPIMYFHEQIHFEFCTFEDIKNYGLEDMLIEKGRFQVVYKIPETDGKVTPIRIKHPAEICHSRPRLRKVEFSFFMETLSDLLIQEGDQVLEGQEVAEIKAYHDEIMEIEFQIKSNLAKLESAKKNLGAEVEFQKSKMVEISGQLKQTREKIKAFERVIKNRDQNPRGLNIFDNTSVSTGIQMAKKTAQEKKELIGVEVSDLKAQLKQAETLIATAKNTFTQLKETLHVENNTLEEQIQDFNKKRQILAPCKGIIKKIQVTTAEITPFSFAQAMEVKIILVTERE